MERASDNRTDDSPDGGPTEDEQYLFDDLRRGGMPRRDFLKAVSGAGAGVFGLQLLTEEKAYAAAATLEGAAAAAATAPTVPVKLLVNKSVRMLDLDPRV